MNPVSDVNQDNGPSTHTAEAVVHPAKFWLIRVILGAFVVLCWQATLEANRAFEHWGDDVWAARGATWCATGFGIGIYVLVRWAFRWLKCDIAAKTGRVRLLLRVVAVIVMPLLVIIAVGVFVIGTMYIGLWFNQLVG